MPLLWPWTDHWFVGPDADACRLVMQAKPWVQDEIGNHCDLLVLNSHLCHLTRGMSLAWVQVLDRSPGNCPFDIAFDTLMQPQF